MAEDVKYIPWVAVVALRRPLAFLVMFVALGAICSFLTFEFLDLSDPLAGLRLVNDEVAEQSDGWVMGLWGAEASWNERDGVSPDVKQVQQSVPFRCLTLLYIMHGEEGNVYTPDRLRKMREIETQVISFPKFVDHCLVNPNTGICNPFDSILNFIELDLDGEVTQEMVNDELRRIWTSGQNVGRFFHKSFDGEERLKSNMTRSAICFGLPLKGFLNSNLQRTEQYNIIKTWLREYGLKDYLRGVFLSPENQEGMSVYYDQGMLEQMITDEVLGQDILHCIFAVVFVLVVMILHMRSVFLATFALLQVLLSFPIAFFVYRILLGIELFGGLQSIAIFVVIGVGADDCFIFVDAFKQTIQFMKIPGWDLDTRLSFAFKRARFTMMVTTVTTGFAFLMLSISSIPTVRYFGIFAAILIMLNFCLVMTMYTCVLVLWDRYFRPIHVEFRRNHQSSAVKEEKEDAGTVDGDDEGEPNSNDGEERFMWRRSFRFLCFGTLTVSKEVDEQPEEDAPDALSVVSNGRRSSRFPNGVDLNNLDEELMSLSAEVMSTYDDKTQKQQGEKSRPVSSVSTSSPYPSLVKGVTKEEDFSKVTRFLVNKRNRVVLLVVFFLLAATFGAIASQLRIATKENPFWPEEHFFWWYRQNVPDNFHDASDVPRKTFHIVHGLEEPFADRTGTKDTIPGEFGKPIYSSSIDFRAPETQQFIFNECKDAFTRERDLHLAGAGSRAAACYMVAFGLWRQAQNMSFPVPMPSPARPVLDIPFPEEALLSDEPFDDLMVEFFSRAQFKPLRRQVDIVPMRGANESRLGMRFGFQSFNTDLDWEDPYRTRVVVSEDWDAFLEDLRAKIPATMGSPENTYYTEWDYFVLQKTQFFFLVNSFTSLGLSTALTLVFLVIATRNWKVSLLAGVTICGISVTVLGCVVLIGWELDTIISVSITLLVGFVADYTVHLAVAYDEANRERGLVTPNEKVDHLVRTMAVSIAAGAASTFGASTMLLPTTIRFFQQFGGFLSLAVGAALIWATIFFPALLSRFGPAASQGRFLSCLENKKGTTLYELSHHTKRSKRGAQIAVALAMLFMGGVFCSVFFGYGVRTNSFLWELEPEPPTVEPSIWPTEGTPSITELDTGRWYKLSPGGETVCARGEPFSFFFRKASVPDAKLVIEFEGGDPCWNFKLCRAEERLIRDNIDLVQANFASAFLGKGQLNGMADPQGPFASAHHLFIPLCTGDFHWGNRTKDYGSDVVIEHKGAVNALSAISWALREFELLRPSSILFTGVDSGSYGAIIFSSIVAGWLEFSGQDDAIRFQLHGDSGVGLFAPKFLQAAVDSWGVELQQTNLDFLLQNQTFEVPLWLLNPGGFAGLFNLTNWVNLQGVRDCVETVANQTGGLNITTEDYLEFFLTGQGNQVFLDCLNTTSAFNGTGLPDGWDLILFDEPVSLPLGGRGMKPEEKKRRRLQAITPPDEAPGIDWDWGDWVDQNCINATLADLLLAGNGTNPVDFGDSFAGCVNFTIPTNLTGFDPSDFFFDGENPVQLIPSLYLLNGWRYRKHVYSQFSTAYDYQAARQLAVQYTEVSLPGVTINEQRLFFQAMTFLYDVYKPFMPPNYHHFLSSGDFHGHIKHDRHYRVVSQTLFQTLFAWASGMDPQGLPQRWDCRTSEQEPCLRGVDDREQTLYF